MKTKKIILIAVAVVVVVGAGIWFFAGSPAKHKVTYATTTVSKGDISNSCKANWLHRKQPMTVRKPNTNTRKRTSNAAKVCTRNH